MTRHAVRRLLGAVLLLTVAAPGIRPAGAEGVFKPMTAVVVGKGDLANPKGVIATIQVELPEGQAGAENKGFKKGARIDLQITEKTKIVKLVDGKRVPAKLDDLTKGTLIEFGDYDGIQQSNPAIIEPGSIVILKPAK